MLMLPPSVKIYLAVEPVDMRTGIDGLMAVIRNQFGLDAFSGHLFVFISRRKNGLKVLFWDAGGVVVYYRRLEAGRFKRPLLRPGEHVVSMTSIDLAMLLEGIDLSRVGKPKLWSPHKTSAKGSTSAGVEDLTWLVNTNDHTCAWREEVIELRKALKARDSIIAEYACLQAKLEIRDAVIAQNVAVQAQQAELLEVIQGQFAALQHRVFKGGRDKMTSPADAIKKAHAAGKRGATGKRKDGKKARKDNAAARGIGQMKPLSP